MDSNTHSTDQPAGPPDEVAALGTAVAALAAQEVKSQLVV
jgi:hypothetical protein